MNLRLCIFVLAVAAFVPSALSLSVQSTLTGVDAGTTPTFAAEYAAELELLTADDTSTRIGDVAFTSSGTGVDGDDFVTSITFTISETTDKDIQSAQSIYNELMNYFRYGSTSAMFNEDRNFIRFTTALTQSCFDSGENEMICTEAEEDSDGASTLLIAGLVFVAWIIFLAITLELCLRYNSNIGAGSTTVTVTDEDKV